MEKKATYRSYTVDCGHFVHASGIVDILEIEEVSFVRISEPNDDHVTFYRLSDVAKIRQTGLFQKPFIPPELPGDEYLVATL